ncbi:hypothetical protein BRD17_06420 [Halobacteriales archaeon SW_7_68_16]|nr:MAG: hypothetical protein BRD17_06420 [Halobacteriales archaeon SW_7_68_16]
MSEYEYATKRDQCWTAILQHAFKHDTFLLRDVYEKELDGDDGSINYATLRRTARGMQELGWLSRESEKAQNWHRGILSDLLLAERDFGVDAIEGNEEIVAQDEDLRDSALLLSGIISGEEVAEGVSQHMFKEALIDEMNERIEELTEDLDEE